MNELDSNMRLTSQRQVIFEELIKVKSHPTANEVYDMVRKRLPRIGLGTVYRNLNLLAELGIIRRLEVGGEQKLFDGDISPHYHIRCIKCNRVDDIFIKMDRGLEKSAASCCDYKILDHHVQFSGICSKCLPKT
ncbi:MAG: transcriptional repressor [Desulfobulbaceae bacterium]|jgi:Fur family ferric uptake transcriptional regulator|nr:transcriptional repressor [Desulfobulbaceae bacterium]MDH3782514.1 transcriptional repressor [Desulfobulbaceae bacterium]MDH3922705.1 transcriptional repressor [Desulfobulbaceae bacterium]